MTEIINVDLNGLEIPVVLEYDITPAEYDTGTPESVDINTVSIGYIPSDKMREMENDLLNYLKESGDGNRKNLFGNFGGM